MYPVFRVMSEALRHRTSPPLGFFDTHVTTLTCWPWDIDVFLEMNNGRTLTLYDLGRFGLFQRMGVMATMKQRGWSSAVAGSTVRYRRRVRAFQRVEVRTRVVGYDARFSYIEHSMWRQEDCTSHALIRAAITDKNGIVPSELVAEALGIGESPKLPDWVQAWAEAETVRPWPPDRR